MKIRLWIAKVPTYHIFHYSLNLKADNNFPLVYLSKLFRKFEGTIEII